jgi:hypothetical protein
MRQRRAALGGKAQVTVDLRVVKARQALPARTSAMASTALSSASSRV